MKSFQTTLLAVALCSGLVVPALGHGDLHEQIEEVTKSLAANPRDAVLYHKRGELHRAHAHYDKALRDYAEAEKLSPQLDVIFLSRGRALLETEKFADALAALNTFLERQANHWEACWFRAQVLVKLGRRKEAEKDFRRVIESASEISPEQVIERARNLEASGQVRAALAAVEEGIKRMGPLITLELTALDLEVAAKEFQTALQRVDTLVQQANRKETYLVRKAEVLEQMDAKEQARECYRKALDAIAALPERQRKLKSTLQLEQEIRQCLAEDPTKRKELSVPAGSYPEGHKLEKELRLERRSN